MLKPWDERRKKSEQVDALLQATNGYFFTQVPEAFVFAFNAPEIIGLGTTAGLEVNLEDHGSRQRRPSSPAIAQQFAQDLGKTGDVVGVNTTIRADAQQLYLDVDREKAKSLGVSLTDVFTTLQTMLAYDYVNDFNLYGKTYHVQVEAQAPFRQRPEDIGKFYVRSAAGRDGADQLAGAEHRSGPGRPWSRDSTGLRPRSSLARRRPGKSSGQMLAATEKLIKDKYEAMNIGYGFSGQSYPGGIESTGQGGIVFALGSGDGVPRAGRAVRELVDAAGGDDRRARSASSVRSSGLFLLQHPNDLYFDVGLLVVIGLEAKNAILMVEFAIEQRATGKSIEEAAVEAGRERIRPILMTSFAFILGVVPLVVASGAGARRGTRSASASSSACSSRRCWASTSSRTCSSSSARCSERMAARVHHAHPPCSHPAQQAVAGAAGDD